MVSATSLLQGLKYMIITLDIKIIIIKQEILEPFQIIQSELMGQYRHPQIAARTLWRAAVF